VRSGLQKISKKRLRARKDDSLDSRMCIYARTYVGVSACAAGACARVCMHACVGCGSVADRLRIVADAA
jgi:hypothetical protein